MQTYARKIVVPTFISACALAQLLHTSLGFAAEPDPLRVVEKKGVVAADTPDASSAGAEILRQGGNAVDAAIATALALGVVSPAGSGLGGGGFAVVWSVKEHKAQVIDFREVAPKAATRDMFASDPKRSIVGGLAVAVPGEPAGLAALHDRLGKLPLSKVVAPAMRLAKSGFFPTHRLAAVSARVDVPAGEPMGRWLKPGGKAMNESQRVLRPELAATLGRLGRMGRDAFYKGDVAADLVSTVRSHGGVLTLEDLASYVPVWREPLVGQYHGRQLYAAPPPAGGTTALEALHFLDALPPLPKGSLGSSVYFHRIAEALSHAFADRARWMGDPAFFTDGEVPMATLATPAYGKALAARFREDSVQAIDTYGTPAKKGSAVEPPRDHGTSHLCVMDGEGNVVAMTTTVNLELGAQLEAPKSGVLLNDQMDDFAARPGRPNGFGLVGAEANSIAPGKKPLSSMTPMIVVENGNAIMCVGGSGGPTIVASSIQAIVAVLDEEANAETAVATPRVYAQWRPELLAIERDIPNDVADGLQKRGHKLRRLGNEPFAPAIQVILHRNGELEAASDPRKGGAPAAP